jgi:hypothetical protein
LAEESLADGRDELTLDTGSSAFFVYGRIVMDVVLSRRLGAHVR